MYSGLDLLFELSGLLAKIYHVINVQMDLDKENLLSRIVKGGREDTA